MIVALPFHEGDVAAARELLQWIRDLSKYENHELLLVADHAVPWFDVQDLIHLASGFGRVHCTTNTASVKGWPAGANSLFFTAARYLSGHPFLWLEPDAIPLSASWLEAIHAEYQACKKPFLGDIYSCDNINLPKVLMSGVAVYPEDAWERLKILQLCPRAWDVEMAHIAVPNGVSSKTIQHFWGLPNLPPTFAESRAGFQANNVFTLHRIRQGAVLWHRNKDGSLICVLRRKFALGNSKSESMIVVLPFCSVDWTQAYRNFQWMMQMSPHCGLRLDCILSCDTSINAQQVQLAVSAAQSAFHSMEIFQYQAPHVKGWPMAPNYAFQQTALNMVKYSRPWLWLEADAIPVRPDWMQALQVRYARCRKPFMGPIVANMGHMNGVGVYPHDFPRYSPTAMKVFHEAWDFVMSPDVIPHCHDASDLFQHCWGIVGGKPHYRDGPPASFTTQDHVNRWLSPSAVIFHRNKDGSLIDRLRERNK